VIVSRELSIDVWIRTLREQERLRRTIERIARTSHGDWGQPPLPTSELEWAELQRDQQSVADRVATSLAASWPDLPEKERQYIEDVLERRRQLRERVVPAEQEHEVTDPEKPSQAAADLLPHGGRQRRLDIDLQVPPATELEWSGRGRRHEDIFGTDEPERS
jgi:hypothetical protein